MIMWSISYCQRKKEKKAPDIFLKNVYGCTGRPRMTYNMVGTFSKKNDLAVISPDNIHRGWSRLGAGPRGRISSTAFRPNIFIVILEPHARHSVAYSFPPYCTLPKICYLHDERQKTKTSGCRAGAQKKQNKKKVRL